MFLIKWTSGDWKNWVDEIPSGWSLDEGTFFSVAHYCAKNKKRIECFCDIHISPKSMTLDYGKGNKSANSSAKVPPGQTRLTFDDDRRLKIKKIEWADEGEEFEEVAAETLADEGYEGSEGNIYISQHMRRERDPYLRECKIRDVISKHKKLACEICELDFAKRYRDVGDMFCEVHHVRPLQEGARKVTIHDLAVLCANCHRMIHRTNPIKSIEDFRAYNLIRIDKML